MKQTLKNLVLFFSCNIFGYALSLATFVIAIEFIDIEKAQLTGNIVQYDMGMILVTWFVCAIFSLSFFFLAGLWKKIFLIAPIIIPLLLTITTLIGY